MEALWVEIRVVDIRKVVDCNNWSFILGKENPADIPTRICEISDFGKWFEGPEFLHSGKGSDDSFDVEARSQDADVLVEAKKFNSVTTTTIIIEDVHDISKVIDCKRFSSFDKLITTTALVLRFTKKLKTCIRNRRNNNTNVQEKNLYYHSRRKRSCRMVVDQG